MNFYSRDFLSTHCESILNFYTLRVVDENGGYFQNYYDDGEVFNAGFKQLVSSTRIIVNYANSYTLFGNEKYKEIALHGLTFLETVHFQPESERYAWTLQDNQPLDLTQQAYGYAFVLLAYAALRKAGIIESNDKLNYVYDLLEQRFWQADYGLYADEISESGELSPYRGQNANMHLCEAMLSAYQATKETKFLDRAETLAHNIAYKQAALSDNLIWEHYTPSFDIDWEYNKDDPKNLYRPWGFQPGHQTEWTKLLLILHRYRPDPRLVQTAKSLFDRAVETAWDDTYGGLIYGFDDNGKWCDDDKYFWVQAESFAAAALLYEQTKESRFLDTYAKLWQYSWEHMVDHQYGAWFRVLKRTNAKYSNEKSAAGAKCDYHTLGACFDVLSTLSE
ncbi:AGE family epimerase/isomerase [Alteromonas sp. ALT199]|uniref:AGE family epimerase/isomerase n=1 Tax=unclassified Alteromonas TaxID=2614992 RepID=UPI001BE9BBF4|nr:AGE family epimerase/isomerase [Alteromonas sp. ALT199]MBT3136183.1 AGE family epimerase/isomerase [Alteromonas sp. ALT199]